MYKHVGILTPAKFLNITEYIILYAILTNSIVYLTIYLGV